MAMVFMLSSCQKDISVENNDTITNTDVPFLLPAPSPVNGTVSGLIVDENNAAVASAVVRCAGVTTNTDANGFFNISNVTLDKYITTVSVTKAGYFKGYRSFSANASRNYVNIKLIPKTLSGNITSSTGGTITLPNTTEIVFQSNSFVEKNTGIAYNGTVKVYASYIDPTRDDISTIIPGSLMGRDANNLYVLQSKGMIAVDLESTAGVALQLATNKPAAIKLFIPTALAGTAPNTIDTWSLDEQGVWKKENTATKIGNYYQMNASHFSYWNCDISSNAIYLSLHIQNQQGNSLPNTATRLKVISQFNCAYGTTDNEGNVSGLVPSNVGLQFDIYSGSIGCTLNSLYTQNIGPYSTNASTIITATLSTAQNQQSVLNVSGVINGCNGLPLQSGTVFISSFPHFVYANVVNGAYSAAILHCQFINPLHISLLQSSNAAPVFVGLYPINSNSMTIPATSACNNSPLNLYDGVYNVTGSFVDYLNPTFTGVYPKRLHLITTSPTSVIVADSINGEMVPGYLFLNNGAGSFYGSFGLQLSFNSSTNFVNEIHNYYGDPTNVSTGVGNPSIGTGAPMYASSNTRTAVLDPTGTNYFNSSNRVLRLKYFMNQPSTSPNGPRAAFDETWTYIGPRP